MQTDDQEIIQILRTRAEVAHQKGDHEQYDALVEEMLDEPIVQEKHE